MSESISADKLDMLRDAVEEFEVASDAVTDAISDLKGETEDTRLRQMMDEAEPDQNVYAILKDLVSEVEGFVEDETG